MIWLYNLLMVAFVGFILYFSHTWAGGDCKLALFIGMFFPTDLLLDYNDNRFTLWIFLVISFCVGIIYLIFDSVILLCKGREKIKLKSYIGTVKLMLTRYVECFIYLTALNQIYLFFIYPHYQINSVLYIAISIAFIVGVSKIKLLTSKYIILAFMLFDIAMIVFTGNISFSTYWPTYLLVLAFMFLRSFVLRYNYQIINTKDVVEGMVISKVDTMLFQYSKVKGLPKISDETLKSRITKDEASSIQRWEKSKYGKDKITIVRKMPFAIFLMAGILLYSAIGVLQYCYFI